MKPVLDESRLCMLFLQKIHVGEVQCSVWPQDMRDELRLKNVILL
jgi:aspartate--ammonia ligase